MLSITFTDCVENIGLSCYNGFFTKDLKKLYRKYSTKLECEYIDICQETGFTGKAGVLIMRNAVEYFLGKKGCKNLKKEYENKTKNIHMKTHPQEKYMCLAEFTQDGDTIVKNIEEFPLTEKLRKKFQKLFDLWLVAEVHETKIVEKRENYEQMKRKIVISCRLSEQDTPLCFRWVKNGKPVSKSLKINIRCGDIYFLSKRAVGYDVNDKGKYRLIHSTD